MQRIQLDPVMLEEARKRLKQEYVSMKLVVTPEQEEWLSGWFEDFMWEMSQGRQREEDPRQLRLFD